MAYESLRWRDDPRGHPIICAYCKHYNDNGSLTCDAFPNGIPVELLWRKEHDTPFEGDHGIRFEPIEENK